MRPIAHNVDLRAKTHKYTLNLVQVTFTCSLRKKSHFNVDESLLLTLIIILTLTKYCLKFVVIYVLVFSGRHAKSYVAHALTKTSSPELFNACCCCQLQKVVKTLLVVRKMFPCFFSLVFSLWATLEGDTLLLFPLSHPEVPG